MASPTPRYTILVTIVEGRYFIRDPDCQLMVQCQFNDALFIENPETDSHSYPEVLSTDPVEQTPYPIWDTELAWDLDAEVLDILRVEHASLKLTCFSVNQKTNEEESLGHIILDLSTAFEPESADEQWAPLTGSQTAGFRGLQPELKLAFTIDDGIANLAEANTNIESTSAPSAPEESQQKRFSKAHILQGLEEEDEPEDQYDDRDANVPSVGDKSFYRSRNHPDTEVPEFDADDSMQVDIPVDIGEALIPTEVNDKGFLQLGTGRDFFIFTITIQTTQGMESLIDQYAALQRRSVDSVEQGLYLYYSFLGNNVATQLLSNAESGAPIEEIALRLKSSMESMYQHFREGEELVIHLCHESNLIATATIPLALILLHGTANLFHASPQFHPFQPAIHMPEEGSSPSSSDVASIQVAMHVTRDLNTLSVPSTPAIRRSSQGTTPRRILTRPAAIEVDTSRNVNSAGSTRSPRRHDYKFSIELISFKSLSRSLSNVSLRYNYRPFGPKSTQPSINADRMIRTQLPDACRTFQLCQTPSALRNQLKTPLVVEVWCQDPETHQNVLHASGQIPLIDILEEELAPTSEGRIQRLHSSFVAVVEGGSIPAGEIQFACSLEDLGEYFDSQQSEILSTTPVHSMELHNHSRGLSDDLSTSGPEPQYGFHPRGNNIEVTSSVQGEERSLRQQPSVSHFAEGYSDHERMESSGTPGRSSQRPTSVRLSQVRHLSQAHQNTHPHHHHPYGKPSSPSGKSDPPMDYHMALKQQLAKQAEVNRQVEHDLLRRSPISNMPHSIQQTLQTDRSTTRPGTTLSMFENTDAGDDNMNAQQAKQKLKDIKALDYQLQKQVIALEFRERKLLRAEEALQRQQANFQKLLERHGYSQGGIQHLDQPFVFQPSASASASTAAAGTGAQPNMSSNPTPQDFFLLQDRYRALQRQNQLLEVEFSQYRQEHPTHINMASVNSLHQKIAELESANNKLMNDVTFANNYKEHYKALWTHSLQEIASMRQDLQMGMEIKMMQQFNEVDQLKLMNMTRAEADHGQVILRGVKTEIEMLQHQMQPLFPGDMTWEGEQHQEVPRRHHPRSDPEDEYDNDEEDSDEGSQFDRRGRSQQQYPFAQSRQRYQSQQQQQQQQQQSQQHYRGGQQQQQYGAAGNAGYEPFLGSAQSGGHGGKFQGSFDTLMDNGNTNNYTPRRYSQAHPANLSLQEDEDEHEDTLVDNTMMKSMSGQGSAQQKHYQYHQKQKPLQGSKHHGGSTMAPFTSAQSVHS